MGWNNYNRKERAKARFLYMHGYEQPTTLKAWVEANMTPDEVFSKYRNDIRRRTESQLYRIDEHERQLQETLDNYRSNPLQIIGQDIINVMKDNYGIDVKILFEDIAKAADRLFITIIATSYNEWTLKLPNNVATQQIVAGLNIIAKPFTSASYREYLTVDARARSWTYVFRTAEGKDMLDQWIETCQSDSLFQAVLRFGPEIDGEIDYDNLP